MLQTLRNRRSRKGFTLAELLIVVAIIAVLVAIAVPLFVGALNDAEKRVGEADCRSVRAAAVAEILLKHGNGDDATYGATGPWYVTAKVDGSGEITELTITKDESSSKKLTLEHKVGVSGKETAAWAKADNVVSVEVIITSLTATPGT